MAASFFDDDFESSIPINGGTLRPPFTIDEVIAQIEAHPRFVDLPEDHRKVALLEKSAPTVKRPRKIFKDDDTQKMVKTDLICFGHSNPMTNNFLRSTWCHLYSGAVLPTIESSGLEL